VPTTELSLEENEQTSTGQNQDNKIYRVRSKLMSNNDAAPMGLDIALG